MDLALDQSEPTEDAPQPQMWMPPQRLRQYQWVKLGGALLFAAIFTGWLIIQWSNPVMRFGAIGLLLLTGWITLSSILEDCRRSRGRQITLDRGVLQIAELDRTQSVRLGDVVRAEWRELPCERAGLCFLDRGGQILACVGPAFLADQVEARTFVGWLRRAAHLKFEVRWPAPADLS